MPLPALRFAAFALAFTLAATVACGDEDPVGIENTRFASSLGVDIPASTRTASGLYYRDITVGTGAAAGAGSTVSVRYSGAFANGTVFDPGTDPIGFTVGQRQVIDGFDEGVRGMRVGGKRQLIIPPDLGYGPNDYGPIPGNSILVFTIELLSTS